MTTKVTKESLAARIAELEAGPRSIKEAYRQVQDEFYQGRL